MPELTEEMLHEAVKKCKWRQDFNGIPICAGDVAPCQHQIESGQCTTLLELVAKHKKETTKEERSDE